MFIRTIHHCARPFKKFILWSRACSFVFFLTCVIGFVLIVRMKEILERYSKNPEGIQAGRMGDSSDVRILT